MKKYLVESKGKKIKKVRGLQTITEEIGKERGNETVNEVELFTKEEQEIIINRLIQKVETYSKEKKLPTEYISRNCISDLEILINKGGAVVYKCLFSCKINTCTVSVPCVYNKHWQISNLERHLKLFHILPRKPNADKVEQLKKILEKGNKPNDTNNSCNNQIVDPITSSP